MSYLESLAKNKFDGDIEAAREWLSSNGRKGGKTGKKHFSKVTRQTLQRYNKKGQPIRAEKMRKRNMRPDEKILEEYLDEEGNVVE